jgi:hypothetical protein
MPGDTLCVGPGNYNEQINVRVSGTASAPINIRAFDPTNHPIVDGAYSIPGGKSFFSTYTYNDSSRTAHTTQCYEYSANTYGQPVNPNANLGPFPLVACQAPNSLPNGTPNNNVLVTIQASYVVWNGIDVTRSRGKGVLLGNGSGFGDYIVGGASGTWYDHIDFVNSSVSHIRGGGVMILNASDLNFLGNSITDAGNFADYDHSIQDYGGNNYNVWGWPNALNATGKNLVLKNNKIYETFTEGIQIGAFVLNPPGVQYPAGAWNSAQNITFSQNVIYDTWSAGLYIGNFDGAVIDGNIVYNTGNPKFVHFDQGTPASCVAITSESGSFQNPNNLTFTNNIVAGCGFLLALIQCNQCFAGVNPTYSNLLIANNTLMNPHGGGSVLYSTMSQLSGFTFANNLISASGAAMFSSWFGFNALPSGSVYGNNVWSSSPNNTGTHGGNGSAQQATMTGTGDVVSSSPGLSNGTYLPAAGNFDPAVIKLLGGSPALNAGRRISAVVDDFFGSPRPTSGPYDVGAYQH